MEALILLLILVDLFYVGVGYNTYVPREDVYPVVPAIRFMRNEMGLYRTLPVYDAFPFTPSVYDLHNALGANTVIREEYSKYFAVIPFADPQFDFGTVYVNGYRDSNPIDLLNVKYIVTPPGTALAGQITLVHRGEVYIYSEYRKLAFPSASFPSTSCGSGIEMQLTCWRLFRVLSSIPRSTS
jgi:hypothetical protein